MSKTKLDLAYVKYLYDRDKMYFNLNIEKIKVFKDGMLCRITKNFIRKYYNSPTHYLSHPLYCFTGDITLKYLNKGRKEYIEYSEDFKIVSVEEFIEHIKEYCRVNELNLKNIELYRDGVRIDKIERKDIINRFTFSKLSLINFLCLIY